MASIPILAAVASAIIVPVAGTGIYYSVRSSKQKEGEVSAEIERKLQNLTPNVQGRTMTEPRSGLLQTDRIEKRLESMDEFEQSAQQEQTEAKANINELLKNGGSLDLNSVFPSTFRTQGANWAGSHSSSHIRRT